MFCHEDVAGGDEGGGAGVVKGDAGHVDALGPAGGHFGVSLWAVALEDGGWCSGWGEGG